MATATHAQLVVEILNKFKDEAKPSRAISAHLAHLISLPATIPNLEEGAYEEAMSIAHTIYNKGTRVGYKNGIETAFQDIAELKDKLI